MPISTNTPPRRPVLPSFDGDPGPAAWVQALQGYLELREQRVDCDSPEDLLEWLRLNHLRENIPEGRRDRRNRPDQFGLQHPAHEHSLDWSGPILSEGGQALGSARIEAVGREALVMALPFDLRPDQRYRLHLRTGSSQHAELLLLPIWQSRAQVNCWKIGAAVARLKMTTQERR